MRRARHLLSARCPPFSRRRRLSNGRSATAAKVWSGPGRSCRLRGFYRWRTRESRASSIAFGGFANARQQAESSFFRSGVFDGGADCRLRPGMSCATTYRCAHSGAVGASRPMLRSGRSRTAPVCRRAACHFVRNATRTCAISATVGSTATFTTSCHRRLVHLLSPSTATTYRS
jgi:hypothetical protein